MIDRRVTLDGAGRREPCVAERIHVGLQRRAMLQSEREGGGERVGKAAHRSALPR